MGVRKGRGREGRECKGCKMGVQDGHGGHADLHTQGQVKADCMHRVGVSERAPFKLH